MKARQAVVLRTNSSSQRDGQNAKPKRKTAEQALREYNNKYAKINSRYRSRMSEYRENLKEYYKSQNEKRLANKQAKITDYFKQQKNKRGNEKMNIIVGTPEARQQVEELLDENEQFEQFERELRETKARKYKERAQKAKETKLKNKKKKTLYQDTLKEAKKLGFKVNEKYTNQKLETLRKYINNNSLVVIRVSEEDIRDSDNIFKINQYGYRVESKNIERYEMSSPSGAKFVEEEMVFPMNWKDLLFDEMVKSHTGIMRRIYVRFLRQEDKEYIGSTRLNGSTMKLYKWEAENRNPTEEEKDEYENDTAEKEIYKNVSKEIQDKVFRSDFHKMLAKAYGEAHKPENLLFLFSTYNYPKSLIRGGSLTRAEYDAMKEQCKHLSYGRQGLTFIINDGDYCGLIACVLAETKPENRANLLRPELRRQNQLLKLVEEMGEKIGQKGPMTYFDFMKYSVKFKKSVIIINAKTNAVYNVDDNNEDVEEIDEELRQECRNEDVCMMEVEKDFRISNRYKSPKDLVYILHDPDLEHYHFIDDIDKYCNDKGSHFRWCHRCLKRWKKEQFSCHKCPGSKCNLCYKVFDKVSDYEIHVGLREDEETEWTTCGCNLTMPNECYRHHREVAHKNGIRYKKCVRCSKNGKSHWVDLQQMAFEDHICYSKQCKSCKKYFEGEDHKCFIQQYHPSDAELDTESRHNMGYDIESQEDSRGYHKPNFLVCYDLYDEKDRHVFKGEDCIDKFVKFTMKRTKTSFWAHNSRSYDGWLIQSHLLKNCREKPKNVVLAGNKIMSMDLKSNRFLDSLNHIQGALADFTDTFGLDPELSKGFFAHKFNRKCNEGYKGTMPDRHYYEPERMKFDKMKIFDEWYDEKVNSNYFYDHDKEMEEYCHKDVKLLCEGLKVYRESAIASNGLDPLKSITTASYCMKTYRYNDMEPEAIAILDSTEYAFHKSGFYGGRTSVWKTRTQKLCKYIDVNSLYSSVQMYDYLPTGHCKHEIYSPALQMEDKQQMLDFLESHFGTIECDVYCPQEPKIIPVLPSHNIDGNGYNMKHKKKARYTSIELKKAVEKGYKITNITESYCSEKSNTLFQTYILRHFKTKVQSGGFKGTEDEFNDMQNELETRYGFKFDVEKITFRGSEKELNKIIGKEGGDDNKSMIYIKSNPGMKAISKNCLNNLWGRFAMRYQMSKTEYITDPLKWFKLLERKEKGEIEIDGEGLLDKTTMMVKYHEEKDENTSLISTNIMLASFITANARLRLYSELEKIGFDRIVYMDTDSIVFEYDPEGYNTPTHNFHLGEWKCELNGGFIIDWVCTAPKCYSYKMVDKNMKPAYNKKTGNFGDTKSKGNTLNVANAKVINFETLCEQIENPDKIIVAETRSFVRPRVNKNFVADKDNLGIRTEYEKNKKENKFNYNKRILDGYNTKNILQGASGLSPHALRE